MAYKITTESARIAMANREYEKAMEQLNHQSEARIQELMREFNPTTKEEFNKICLADDVYCNITLWKCAIDTWQDTVIDLDCIPEIQDDGTVRWKPDYSEHEHNIEDALDFWLVYDHTEIGLIVMRQMMTAKPRSGKVGN
jgi:hypothetical protein